MKMEVEEGSVMWGEITWDIRHKPNPLNSLVGCLSRVRLSGLLWGASSASCYSWLFFLPFVSVSKRHPNFWRPLRAILCFISRAGIITNFPDLFAKNLARSIVLSFLLWFYGFFLSFSFPFVLVSSPQLQALYAVNFALFIVRLFSFE